MNEGKYVRQPDALTGLIFFGSNSSASQECPIPTSMGGSPSHSRPYILNSQSGMYLHKGPQSSTLSIWLPPTPESDNGQPIIDLDSAKPRTVDNPVDSKILRDILPHSSAKDIKHGLLACEKSLDGVCKLGICGAATARNYLQFQEEARDEHHATQSSTAHSTKYRQNDDPEVTANSEVDNEEDNYTW